MIWFVLVGFGLTVGDLLVNLWVDNGARFQGITLMYYSLALAVYFISLTMYGYQFKGNPLSVAVVVPVLVNILAVFVISSFFLHERINPHQTIGVLLAVFAIFFLYQK